MRQVVGSLCVMVALAAAAPAGAQQITPGTTPATFVGPQSSETPFVVPSAPGSGWDVTSIITVQDAANENLYQMVGIPDGLGAISGKFDDDEQTYVADKAYMTVFMNHELGATSGVVRAHGQRGAFVSQWTIHLNSLQVKAGQDLIQNTFTWNQAASGWDLNPTALARLCSADLPAATAFYNAATGNGFDGRIFISGEENGNAGRVWGHIITGPDKGQSYELAALGRLSYENAVAHPDAGDKTIVVNLNDSTPGQVYVYVGTKQNTGNAVQRAGLTGGTLYGIKVTNGGSNYANGAVVTENKGAINGTFILAPIPTSPSFIQNGAQLNTNANTAGVTRFARPEDGAWDTKSPRVFYFVTTGASIANDPPATGTSPQSAKLYKLTFSDLSNLAAGGTIELVVDRAALLPSTPTFAQFDNITVDGDGFVLVQEDPGNTPYLAQIWRVNPTTKAATSIFVSDASRFTPPTVAPFNQDEENSGIIEVTDIVKSANWYEKGRRYFLGDMQAHFDFGGGEFVENGQLYLIASPSTSPGPGKDKD